MPNPDLSWYVALVPPGSEQEAEKHLLNVGFLEAFHPRRAQSVIAHGRAVSVMRPVFSGYVLARVDYFTPFLWHDACPAEDRPNHGLVHGFIGGWPAAPVPDEAVQALRAQCDAAGVWLDPPGPAVELLQPGALVRVADDAWSAHTFKVVWDDGRGVNLHAVHSQSFALYIRDRTCILPLLTSQCPAHRDDNGRLHQVEPAPRSPENVRAARPRNRMRRGLYGVDRVHCA